jgi:hypothetical protein
MNPDIYLPLLTTLKFYWTKFDREYWHKKCAYPEKGAGIGSFSIRDFPACQIQRKNRVPPTRIHTRLPYLNPEAAGKPVAELEIEGEHARSRQTCRMPQSPQGEDSRGTAQRPPRGWATTPATIGWINLLEASRSPADLWPGPSPPGDDRWQSSRLSDGWKFAGRESAMAGLVVRLSQQDCLTCRD